MKGVYQAPSVPRKVTVQLESNLLVGSVVTKSTDIQTAGQEVQTCDFSSTSFNQEWE